MDIIKADPTHLSEIYSIEKASFTDPWSERSFLEALSSETVSIYVARDNNKIVGFISVAQVEYEAEILNIATHPKERKRGIGKLMMEFVLSNLFDNKAERGYLEVRSQNLPARQLYEKFGFNIIGVRKNYYKNPPDDAILMLKNLT